MNREAQVRFRDGVYALLCWYLKEDGADKASTRRVGADKRDITKE
jgi:hypothetical protein